jgi:hypothetical protein
MWLQPLAIFAVLAIASFIIGDPDEPQYRPGECLHLKTRHTTGTQLITDDQDPCGS